MTPSALTEEIRRGLDVRDPADSIRAVKTAVRRGLHMVDGSPAIVDTGYFNHSFTPDFILRWDGSRVPDRPVYLKIAEDPTYSVEELDVVAGTRPMIVELFAGESDEDGFHATSGVLQETARRNDSLVATPDALVELKAGRDSRPILGLFDRALLQGGRGFLDARAVTQANDVVSAGVSGAQRLDSEPTRRAVESVGQLLSGQAESRVQRFLQALWVGSGGSESNYPSDLEIAGTLDDDALAFLLQIEGISQSEDFWRRVGSRLEVDQLARLPVGPEYLDNLQHLVRANLDRLWARFTTVRGSGGQISLEDSGRIYPWWSIRGGLLCLMGPSFQAFIGTLAEQVERAVSVEGVEPEVSELLERVETAGLQLEQVRLSVGSRYLTYGSDEKEDVLNDDSIVQFAGSLGPDARVRSAIASLPPLGRRRVNVQFARSSAAGNGPSRVPLRELVLVGVPLLTGHAEQQDALVAGLVKVVPRDEVDPSRPQLW
jgi:hypothetical protein